MNSINQHEVELRKWAFEKVMKLFPCYSSIEEPKLKIKKAVMLSKLLIEVITEKWEDETIPDYLTVDGFVNIDKNQEHETLQKNFHPNSQKPDENFLHPQS